MRVWLSANVWIWIWFDLIWVVLILFTISMRVDMSCWIWARRSRCWLQHNIMQWRIFGWNINKLAGWNWCRSWHSIGCAETLSSSLAPLFVALIDQFCFTGWINSPKAAFARFVLRSCNFDEISFQNADEEKKT